MSRMPSIVVFTAFFHDGRLLVVLLSEAASCRLLYIMFRVRTRYRIPSAMHAYGDTGFVPSGRFSFRVYLPSDT